MVNGGGKTAPALRNGSGPKLPLLTDDTHKEGKPSFLQQTVTEHTDPDPEQAPGVAAAQTRLHAS